MASPLRHPPSLFHALQSREIFRDGRNDALVWNEVTVRRLLPETPLAGHRGCVNRLAWSADGTLLASGSDDCTVRLWPYPDASSGRVIVPTLHEANIFGIRFLPGSNNAKIITGAMDHSVQLHTLDATPKTTQQTESPGSTRSNGSLSSPRPRRRPRAIVGGAWGVPTPIGDDDDEEESENEEERDSARVAEVHTVSFNCHRGRVKEVVTHEEEPNVFWSVSEDGCVRQYDQRLPSHLQQRFASPNVLIAVSEALRGGPEPAFYSRSLLELKSAAVNPLRPYQLAVGASDQFVRLYDRRMAAPTTIEEAGASRRGLVRALVPPHIALGPAARGLAQSYIHVHPTHVSFGAVGDKLLATYHGDHAYCWSNIGCGGGAGEGDELAALDLATKGKGPPVGWNFRRERAKTAAAAGAAGSQRSALGPGVLPAAAERARADGNLALFQHECLEAIAKYTAGLRVAPDSALLWSSRALALLLQNWVGDRAEALCDAEEAVFCDPSSALAHLRRAQTLRDCGLPRSAAAAARAAHALPPDSGLEEYEEDLRRLEDGLEQDLNRSAARERAARGRRGGAAGRRRQGLTLVRRRPPATPAAEDDEEGGAPAQQNAQNHQAGGSGGTGGTGTGSGSSEGDDEEEDEDDVFGAPSAARIDAAFAAALDADLATLEGAPSPSTPAPTPAWLWGAIPGSHLYLQRYVGHANLQTDIKEAVFLGSRDEFVACGSDDGRVFLYDAHTGACLRTLKADEDVVNCIRPHPTLPLLAMSGIDSTVKLWSPAAVALGNSEVEACCSANQHALREGARMMRRLDLRLLDMLSQNPELMGALQATGRGRRRGEEDSDEEGGGGGPEREPVQCRMA